MSEFKLKTISVVEALSSALTEAIYRLEYEPGRQITEAELCARFKVSRNTVREATAGLISCGLLVKEANKGIFVKEITEKDVRDIFRFRALLECEAVRIIIENGRVIPEELRKFAETIEADSFAHTDRYHYFSSNLNFHQELVLASGSDRLIRLYDTIRAEVMLCLCQSKNLLIVNPDNIFEHSHFLTLLESGSGEECVSFIKDHISNGVENIALGFRIKKS